MATNYPGPYELRFFYVTEEPTAIASHQHRISVELTSTPSAPVLFSAISVRGLDGVTVTSLDTWVDYYVTAMAEIFKIGTTISHVELWHYTSLSFAADYVASYTLGVDGGSGSPLAIASQTILSFRSSEGGTLQLQFLGTVHAAGPKTTFPTGITFVNTMASIVLEDQSPIRARDDGFAVAPLFFLPGQNEALWKKLNR